LRRVGEFEHVHAGARMGQRQLHLLARESNSGAASLAPPAYGGEHQGESAPAAAPAGAREFRWRAKPDRPVEYGLRWSVAELQRAAHLRGLYRARRNRQGVRWACRRPVACAAGRPRGGDGSLHFLRGHAPRDHRKARGAVCRAELGEHVDAEIGETAAIRGMSFSAPRRPRGAPGAARSPPLAVHLAQGPIEGNCVPLAAGELVAAASSPYFASGKYTSTTPSSSRKASTLSYPPQFHTREARSRVPKATAIPSSSAGRTCVGVTKLAFLPAPLQIEQQAAS